MKKIVLGVFSILFLVRIVGAAEFNSHIIDVALTSSGNEAMVFLDDGRILWVDASDRALISALEDTRDNRRELRLDINESNGKINGMQMREQFDDTHGIAEQFSSKTFTPSVLSMNHAKLLFTRMDDKTKRRSQCFNRAHGWAYDLWTSNRINSMKVFIFFTRKYIEERKYKWWFHVAPYVLVETETGPQENVLDRSFTEEPIIMKTWSDKFIKTKRNCPVVEKFSDFHNHQWIEDCYLIKTSMYYRSPNDLKRLEQKGIQKLDWNLAEIREGRKQAFKKWRDYNP